MNKPYFEKDNFVLFHADSVPFLNGMPAESVDMIFVDPPYRLSNDGTTCSSGKRVSVNKGDWDISKGIKEDFLFHLSWIRACYRILKSEGTIWIVGTYHSIYTCGFALLWTGFHILNDIALYHPTAPPNLGCRCFAHNHETLLWAKKSKKAKHIFDYKLMREGDWSYDKLKNPGKQMRTVWTIGKVTKEEKKYGKHPTQKSIRLLERVILSSTQKDDLVLDPFTGSSTTGLVAYKHGRKFVGIDNEATFLELSTKRFSEL